MAVPNDETSGFTSYWRIENFDPEPSFKRRLKSKVFQNRRMNASWQIRIEVDDSNLVAYLSKVSNATSFDVRCSLYLLTAFGWKTVFENIQGHCEAGGNVIDSKKLNREEKLYLPNGCLTISFRIWNDGTQGDSCQRVMLSRLINKVKLRHRPIQTFSTLKPSDIVSFPLSCECLCNIMCNLDTQQAKEGKSQWTQTDTNYDFKDLYDLRKILKEKEFSFVTLRTPTKKFSVLKAVVCEKSRVFKAMFKGKMKESDCNLVDIDDIDNQTMDLLVKYFNFDPLNDMKFGYALTLYYAANKYEIDELKKQCVSLFKKELSIGNVCDVLVLADIHKDRYLMNFAQDYFCKNSKAILRSPHWRVVLEHPELVEELFSKFSEYI